MDNRFDKDSSDEFEFKPLSEGLGFHKKVIDLREDSIAGTLFGQTRTQHASPTIQTPTSQMLAGKVNSRTSPLQNERPSFEAPVASGTQKKMATQTPLTWTPSLQNKDILEDKQALMLKEIPANLIAGTFDAAMVAGLALVFSAIVFALTRVDLNDLLEILQSEGGALVAAFVLLVAVFEIYTVTCRSFFGKTLGEWAFESRLGTLADQQRLFYPIQVAIRSLSVALTGFVVLPLLSLVFRKDIPGIVSGVYLYAEKR